MNASERWAQEFVKGLECVKCRTKENLTLYGYDRKPIDASTLTLEQLHHRVPRMDVWCTKCQPKINRLVQGKPRQEHKNLAARIADLAIQSGREATNDIYVREDGGHVTRSEIINHAKGRTCQHCGRDFPLSVLDFHNIRGGGRRKNISSLNYSHWSIDEIIEEIENCVVVCANCRRFIECEGEPSPTETVRFDDAFWKSLYAKQRQF